MATDIIFTDSSSIETAELLVKQQSAVGLDESFEDIWNTVE